MRLVGHQQAGEKKQRREKIEGSLHSARACRKEKKLAFVTRLPQERTENMAQRESYRKMGSPTPNARKVCEVNVLRMSVPCEEAAPLTLQSASLQSRSWLHSND